MNGNMTGSKKLLAMQGIQLHIIKDVLSVPSQTTPISQIQLPASPLNKSLHDVWDLAQTHATTSSLPAALQFNNVFKDILEGEESTNELDPTIIVIMLSLMNGRMRVGKKITKADLISVLTSHVENAANPGLLTDICRSIYSQGQHRSLIAVEEHSIGVSSGDVQPGDVVAVILGCSVPVVLRKVLDVEEYVFIGECYMDGCMRGEAMEILDNGGFKLHEFVLR